MATGIFQSSRPHDHQIEHPTRAFDSSRALVAAMLLAIFDKIIRSTPSLPDKPSPLTKMLMEDGGYSLSITGMRTNKATFGA
jgi:hypothetical protein